MVVNLTIPQTWNELSETQLKNIAHQLECFQTLVKDSPDAITLAATKLYYQLSKELLRHNTWQNIRIALKEIQPKAFQDLTKYLYQSVERTTFIPSVKIKNVTYHAPATRLRNSTIAEFAFADVAFYKWRQTHNNIWLSVLCATLYREEATLPTDIDIRKPFIKLAVDNCADAFQKLNPKTKLAIAYSYQGCRGHIANTYPLIFPKPIEPEEGEAPIQTKKKYISFSEIILDKIEGDPSKLEATNNILLNDFLAIYNNDIKKINKK